MHTTIVVLLLAAACGTTRQVKALELQVSSLTTTVTVLESQIQTLEAKVSELENQRTNNEAASANPVREESASLLFQRIEELYQKGNTAEAVEKAREFEAEYSNTQVYLRKSKTLDELLVIGTAIPPTWSVNIEKVFQGQGQIDLDKGTTIVVFWEAWCPHCQRELPKLSDTLERFRDKGLKVVGFTRITKSASEIIVRDFLQAGAISYPIAKENGDLADLFRVTGIPAAAVVKEGIVVWRGHPARLTDTQITSFLDN